MIQWYLFSSLNFGLVTSWSNDIDLLCKIFKKMSVKLFIISCPCIKKNNNKSWWIRIDFLFQFSIAIVNYYSKAWYNSLDNSIIRHHYCHQSTRQKYMSFNIILLFSDGKLGVLTWLAYVNSREVHLKKDYHQF